MEDDIFVTRVAPLCLKPGDPRKATDILFIILFLINVLAWLKSVIDEVRYSGWSDGFEFNENFGKPVIIAAIHGVVATAAMLSFIFFQTKLKFRVTVYLVILMIVIQVFVHLISITELLFTIFYSDELPVSQLAVALTVVIVCLIYHIATLIIVRESNVNALSEFIDKSCRAVSHSFATVIFSMITSFLALVVSYLTLAFSYRMMILHQDHIGKRVDISNYFCVCTFAFGGVYIINFIRNFGLLATGDYYANYYGTVDKEKMSKVHIFRSIMMVVRNHLGTVALLSTPILPHVIALIMSFRNNRQLNNKPNDPSINFVSKISLIMDITDFALIQTAMYGSNAFKSTRKMFDLHQYSSTLFLALNTVSSKLIEVVVIITLYITLFVLLIASSVFPLLAIMFDHPIYTFTGPGLFIVATLYALFLVHKILIRPAMSTYLIYKMTSIQISDASDKMMNLVE